MFEIKNEFLIAKSKYLFKIIEIASSFKLEKTIEYELCEEQQSFKCLNQIRENNLDVWIEIVEQIIVDIAQFNKIKDVIQTEDFHKTLKTLQLLKALRNKIEFDSESLKEFIL